MIYLDSGATSFRKPPAVARAMAWAMENCANPGRGGHQPAMAAAEAGFACRKEAGLLFDIPPEQVVFTANCTQGLNMAIRTLVRPGDRVLISGFEHNAVTRPLHALGAEILVAGRRLFDWEDTLEDWENGLKKRPKAAIFTQVSNVFGYILPTEAMADLCRRHGVPFLIDAAQGAGTVELSMKELGADFVAMPGHKGLLGPQGTGLLLCGRVPEPLFYGGTGSLSREQEMPEFLPDRGEAGTLNVPGICGLLAGMRYVRRAGPRNLLIREARQAEKAGIRLQKMGFRTFLGPHQAGTVSFVTKDCEETARALGTMGICLRAGLHCAPLAHDSAGTLETGTVRVSFGLDASDGQTEGLLRALKRRSKDRIPGEI